MGEDPLLSSVGLNPQLSQENGLGNNDVFQGHLVLICEVGFDSAGGPSSLLPVDDPNPSSIVGPNLDLVAGLDHVLRTGPEGGLNLGHSLIQSLGLLWSLGWAIKRGLWGHAFPVWILGMVLLFQP